MPGHRSIESPSLRRALIAVDFGASSRAVVRWVARELAPRAELVLAHCLVLPPASAAAHATTTRRDTLTETARAGAEIRMAGLIDALGLTNARIEIAEGDPVTALAALAWRHRVDLIVVGANGARGGIWERIGGSAELLSARACIPVLVPPPLEEAPALPLAVTATSFARRVP